VAYPYLGQWLGLVGDPPQGVKLNPKISKFKISKSENLTRARRKSATCAHKSLENELCSAQNPQFFFAAGAVGRPGSRGGGKCLQKRVSVKRSYGVCDWGRTHIAVERKHTEWRDHHTKQMWHQRGTLTYPRFRTRCTERTWHGRSRLTGTPQRWAFDDLSPLHMQAQRQGWASRPVSEGRHTRTKAR
jgi:hypothetical protein